MLLAWSGENGVGSLGWSQVNATVPSPATGINTGVTGFNGIVLQPYQTVIIVPEPASFALLGLGAAALLIFRRRQ
jgi:hypothetical protein